MKEKRAKRQAWLYSKPSEKNENEADGSFKILLVIRSFGKGSLHPFKTLLLPIPISVERYRTYVILAYQKILLLTSFE